MHGNVLKNIEFMYYYTDACLSLLTILLLLEAVFRSDNLFTFIIKKIKKSANLNQIQAIKIWSKTSISLITVITLGLDFVG